VGLVFIIFGLVTFRNGRQLGRSYKDVGVGNDGEQRGANNDDVEVEQVLELQVSPLRGDDVHVTVPVAAAALTNLEIAIKYLKKFNGNKSQSVKRQHPKTFIRTVFVHGSVYGFFYWVSSMTMIGEPKPTHIQVVCLYIDFKPIVIWHSHNYHFTKQCDD